MLMPGPSTTETPWSRASRPIAAPTSRARSGSQDEPSADAVGKQVAGTLPDTPTWSPRPGALRSPCGPSATMIDSMPAAVIRVVCQKSQPRTSVAFCSVVSEAVSSASGRCSSTAQSCQTTRSGRRAPGWLRRRRGRALRAAARRAMSRVTGIATATP